MKRNFSGVIFSQAHRKLFALRYPQKMSDFSCSYWVNDDDNFDKYKRAESEALEKRRKLLEGDKFSKDYISINMNIDALKSSIYLFPGINIKLKIHKAKDEFFLISIAGVNILHAWCNLFLRKKIEVQFFPKL